MGSDLIAAIVAGALAIAVVVLGWRRRLGVSTDEWLPEFGPDRTAKGPPPPIRFERSPPPPRQRRTMIGFWLASGLVWAGFAIFSTHDRTANAILAVGYLATGLIYWRRWRRTSHDVRASAR
ncbi:MAG TPA: hypothetical protein VG518_05885 [Solirubrobacterales bacterium]|nr:hypothetical protein [Solirubrobacterales bacterium]